MLKIIYSILSLMIGVSMAEAKAGEVLANNAALQKFQSSKAEAKALGQGKSEGASIRILNEDSMQYLQVKGVKIPVISESSALLPVGYVQLAFVGGGSIFNPPKKPLARLAASLLNHGTKKLGNVGFANLLESKAVGLEASVGQSALNIELDFLSEYEDFAYEQLGSLLADPNLTEGAIKDLKTQLKAALLSKQSDFDYQANRLLHKTVFAGTPLAYPSIGNKVSEIDSLSLQEIRSYLRENLTLNRLIIVIGGNLDLESSLKKLGKTLSGLHEGKAVSIPSYKVTPSPIKTLKKDTQQAYIYFASPLDIDNMYEDGYKARVAGFILGSSGFGSRLMEEIRVKRGLAYSTYMYPSLSRIGNFFLGHIQTALDKQDEVIELTQQIVKDFVEGGVTQEELDSAKQFIKGNQPLQEERLSQRLGAKFMNYYNGLPLDYKNEFVKQVEALDLETLNSFIASHPEIANLSFGVVTNK